METTSPLLTCVQLDSPPLLSPPRLNLHCWILMDRGAKHGVPHLCRHFILSGDQVLELSAPSLPSSQAPFFGAQAEQPNSLVPLLGTGWSPASTAVSPSPAALRTSPQSVHIFFLSSSFTCALHFSVCCSDTAFWCGVRFSNFSDTSL